MTNIWTVFAYELRQQFRRRAYLLLTFGLPVLVIVGFLAYGAVTGGDDEEAVPDSAREVSEANQNESLIGLVDFTPEGLFPAPDAYPEVNCDLEEGEADALQNQDPQQVADLRASITKRITSPYCFGFFIRHYGADLDRAIAALEDGDIDALYAVEPDFVENGSVSVYVSGISLEAAQTESLLQDYLLRSALVNMPPEDYQLVYWRLRNPAQIVSQQVTASGQVEEEDSFDQNFIAVYGFGLSLMFGLMWGGGYVMQSVVAEKESRIVEIIMSSVRPVPLLAGKVLAMGLTSLLQIVMWIGTFAFMLTQLGAIDDSLSGIEISGQALAFIPVYFVLGFLLFGSLMAAIGALSTTLREAQNFVVVVTLPAAVPFFFISVIVTDPNGTLPTFMSIFPLTAALSMVMRMSVTSVPVGEVLLSIGLLVLTVAGAVWLSGRLFRVNTLLMGNMPKLRDIPKLLRG